MRFVVRGCGVCLRCAWPERGREDARTRADLIICIYMYMCRLARKRADQIMMVTAVVGQLGGYRTVRQL